MAIPLDRCVLKNITMIKIPAGSHGIIYARVSTAHQAEDELPVDSQIAELKAAVAAAGATCEVVTDAGISGTDFEHRPGLQEIVARAREPKPNFQWVLVWKLSRFGRDIEEGLIYPRRPAQEGHRADQLQGADPGGLARCAHHPHPHGGRPVLRRGHGRRRPPSPEGARPPGLLGWETAAGRLQARAGAGRYSLRRDAADPRPLGA